LLLVASLVMATSATTLVAVVPLYADAIADAGFERTLDDADPVERSVVLTTRASATDVASIADEATATVDQRLPGASRTLTFATSRDYRLDPARFDESSVASIAVVVSGEPVFTVVSGSRAATASSGRLAVSLAASAARELGLAVGDRVVLDGRAAGLIEVEIVALVEPADPFDDLWLDRPELRDGVQTIGSFRTFGPFLVDPEAFAALDSTVSVTWRAVVDAGSITPSDVVALRAAARRLDGDLAGALPGNDVDVSTGLPQLLSSTDTALGSSGAVIAVILLQIVGLALYGLALASSVLSSSRLVETSLLRSRGATARQVGALAVAESMLVVVPAAVAGPLLAQSVVGLIERWGPVASTGLDLDPSISTRAVVASAVVAAVSVVVIVWPAVRSAQALADAKSEQTRASRPGALQRSGADIVIAALAVLGLWQLTQSSAATRDLSGRLGTDPVLVLAPTLGVIAASLITLRLIGGVARVMQDAAASGTGLSTALAGWELARRPARTARTSVLVVLAVTIGTFATVQGATWDRSQREQADATVSADLVVRPDLRPAADVGAVVLSDTLGQLEGVDAVVPLDRPIASISRSLGNIATVAVDTATAPDVIRLRSDLMRPAALGVLRQPVDLGAIPLGAVDGDLTATLAIRASGGPVDDELVVVVVVVDRFGTLHRVEADAVPALTSTATLTFRLTQQVGEQTSRLAGPVGLVRIDVLAPIVSDVPNSAAPKEPARFELTLTDMALGGRLVELEPSAWDASEPVVNNNTLIAAEVSATAVEGGVLVDVDTGLTEQRRSRLTAAISTSAPGLDVARDIELPVLVTPALLAALELSVGDVAVARVAGASTSVRLVGVTPVVPFAVDEDLAMLVDWPTLSAARYVLTGRFDPPTEYALAVDPGDVVAVAASVRAEPISAEGVLDRRATARRLADDPFAVGLFGSLGLALAGSLLVAIVGLLLAAVVGARERRTAYSVLRAMGTPRRTLRRWLLLEVVPLVALSAVAGLAAGILLASTAINALTVTAEGVPAVPSPRLVIPWASVGLVVGVALVAGIIVPLLTGRLLGRNSTADDLRIGDAA